VVFFLHLRGGVFLGTVSKDLGSHEGGKAGSLVPPPRPEGSQAPSRDRFAEMAEVAHHYNDADDPSFKNAPPFLLRYKALEKKIVKGVDEKREIEEMLSSREYIASASEYLKAPGPDTQTPMGFKVQMRRLETIDYLIESAQWPKNPSRELVLDAIRELIVAPTIREELPIGAKKSVAGDKMELFQALRGIDPAQAESIMRSVAGTPLERILRYSNKKTKENAHPY
jgi:hypothetical protein